MGTALGEKALRVRALLWLRSRRREQAWKENAEWNNLETIDNIKKNLREQCAEYRGEEEKRKTAESRRSRQASPYHETE